MRFRRPSKVEVSLQLVLGFCLFLIVVDFATALWATSCFVPNPSSSCYPWGMTEGPMEGGSWNYTNRENYLIASAVMIGALVIALVPPFLVRQRWQGMLGTVVVLVLGRVCLALCEHVLG